MFQQLSKERRRDMAIYKDAILQYTRTNPSIAFETFNSLNVCFGNILLFYPDHGLMFFIQSLNTPLNNDILMYKLCTDCLHTKKYRLLNIAILMCILLLPFSLAKHPAATRGFPTSLYLISGDCLHLILKSVILIAKINL